MSSNKGFKVGDWVRVTTHEFDHTPDGTINDGYGFGVTGIIDHFRNNRFHGRQATVLLASSKPGDEEYVDWTLTKIEKVEYNHTHISVFDGSPAMVVSQDANTITLVNEDAFQWTDPANQWKRIS